MVWGKGGSGGAAGLRIIRNVKGCYDIRGFESAREGDGWLHNHKKCVGPLSFGKVFEVGGRGTAGFRIERNAWGCKHFHGFGSGREGGGWRQIQKKCIGLISIHGFGSAGERGGWLRNHEKCMECHAFSWS